MRAGALALGLAGSLAVGGCSLLGIGHYPTGCQVDADCEVLNARDGIATGACMVWQCPTQGQRCQLTGRDHDHDDHVDAACGGDDCDDAANGVFLGAEERCNAVDDDCDGTFDEGALFSASPLSPVLAVADASPTGLALEQDGVGDVVAVLRGTGASSGVGLARIDVGIGARVDATDLAIFSDGSAGCLAPDDMDPVDMQQRVSCFPGTTATASSGPEQRVAVTAASIDACGLGQLRVGLVDISLRTLSVPFDPTTSAHAFGIDAEAGTVVCSGVTRATRGTADRPGATRVALAMHPFVPASSVTSHVVAHGVTVFVGDDDRVERAARPRCDTVPDDGPAAIAAVEALGLWREQAPLGDEDVEVSGDGIPLALGETTARGLPAVVAMDAPSGFLVAFASAGSAEVRWLGPLADLPVTRTSTPALSAPAMLASIAIGANLDDLALAPGRARGTTREVAMLASTDCGTSIAMYVLDLPLAGTPTSIPSAPVALGLPPLFDAGPAAIVFVEAGVLRADAGADLPLDAQGGWIVAVAGRETAGAPTDPVSLYVVRVPEATRMALAVERIDVQLAPRSLVALVAEALPGRAGIVAAAVGPGGTELATGVLSCAPSGT